MNTSEQKTILLVEDEALIALAESQIINGFGYKVIITNSGERAVELAVNNSEINLVLMDIDLGEGINGPDAASQILEKISIPIVFLTSHSERKMVEKVRGITRYGYVIKNSGDFVLRSSIEMAFELFEMYEKAIEREEIMQKQNSLITSVLENSPIGFAVNTTNDGKVVLVSSKFEEIYGVERHGINDVDDFFEKVYIDSDFREEMRKRTMMDIASGDASKMKWENIPITTRMGEHKYITAINIPVPEQNLMVSTVQDVTERKQAEDAFKKERELFLTLINAIPDYIYFKDISDRYVMANKVKLASMNVASIKELVGKTVFDFYPVNDARMYHDRDLAIMQSGVPEIEFEECKNNHKNEKVWRSKTSIPLKDEKGVVTGLLIVGRDITERKQAEISLGESEERYKSLFQNNHAVMLLIDPKTAKIVDANPAACRFYGWSLEEFTAKKITDINMLSPENVISEMQHAREGERNHFFFKHRLATGEIRDVEVFSGPIHSKGQEFLYSLIHDITERKKAEDALLKSQSLLNEMGKIAKVGGWEYNQETQEVRWTKETYCIYEVDSSFPTTIESVKAFYAPDSKQLMLKAWKRTMESGEPYDLELELTTAKGNHRWIRNIGRATYTDGKITGRVGINQDITERKQAEDAIRKERELLLTLIDSIPDFIYFKDRSGKYVIANKEKLSSMGLSTASEIIGKTVFDFYPRQAAQGYHDRDMTIMQTGIPQKDIEECKTNAKGEMRWQSLISMPLRNEAGTVTGLFSIGKDTTKHMLADKEIKSLLEEKELLLKEVHHRIKNNMGTMMSLLSLQAGLMKNQYAAKALKDAQNRLRSMEVLYDRLYRSENLREMSVNDYLPPLVNQIVNIFPNSNMVKIDLKVDDFLLGVKELSSLGIIANELITNTMKHAFVGRAKGSISVSALKVDNRVTVIIGDDGVGIPNSIESENANGFGLILVDTLAKQLNGSIRIDRKKGTKFVLEFGVYASLS